MSWDIYGNPLRRGHCEVHPHVHEEYPCSVCMAERSRNQQQPDYELERLNYELDQQNDYIKELTLSNQNLNMALQKVSDYNLRLEESNKSFVSALQKAEAYNVQLENDRDAWVATIGHMIYLIERVYDSYENNTGYEPSLSVFHRDLDEAYRFLDKTPKQCLAEIKAEAGRAGYHEALQEHSGATTSAEDYQLADQYAARVRQDEQSGTWLKDSNVNGGKRQGGDK